MTLREACRMGAGVLTEAGIEEASLDAWYLLEYVTGISRAMYLADGGRELAPEQEEKYLSLIGKRAERVPLQHLTGVQEFMGLEFLVNEWVLIPRQDTEILVETALEILEQEPVARVLDMCTGSGCILLSILKLTGEKRSMQKAGIHPIQESACITGVGADISEEALCVARQNAGRLGVDAEFLQSDVFSEVTGSFQMIVSNPPYIRTSEIEALQEEVKGHDPYLALDGKEDGLYFYRKIIAESGQYLLPGGYLLFEIGCDQAAEVSAMMEQAGYREVAVKKDLAGLDRVVFGVYDK